MKALILNSGIGKRLRPFTKENPKCLAKLHGKTILEYEIETLLYYGIKDIIITTGHFEEKIKKVIADKFPELKVTYVNNPKCESTNNIYSIWLAKSLIDDDILLMHGDMVFDKELLGRLLEYTHRTSVLVNNKIKVPEKDFKSRIKDGDVKEIGVNVFGKAAFFLAPVYKFSKEDFNVCLKEIDRLVKKGDVTLYAEDAFNNIFDQIKLYPVYYGDEFCMEIDNYDDLEIARKFLANNKTY
ncbi:MAG: phosphocholine cytidylyltransferase family protein [Nanoarchaeota archaeon]